MSHEPHQLIPVAAPDLGGREEEYVVQALRSSWISSTGEFLDRFEAEFGELCGTSSAVAVCNGTAALHLAMLALDVGHGDEVLVPSLTYIATANAVRYVGAEPVFVDIDPDTWCIDPDAIEASITLRTRGIIAVHLYGHPADMDRINDIAAAHGLWVVEDAAEAHLATYKGRPVGGLATMGTFSFYGNKMFTSGEGGALTLSDPTLDLRLRTLRGQGVDPLRRYHFPVTGYNFRITNVACAILCAQLERRTELVRARLEIYRLYAGLLASIPGLGTQPIAPWARPAPWLYCVTVDAETFGLTRDQLIEHLSAEGIDSRPFFIPLHTLPPFREASRERDEKLPVTERVASVGLNLPTFPGLTRESQQRIGEAIASAHDRATAGTV